MFLCLGGCDNGELQEKVSLAELKVSLSSAMREQDLITRIDFDGARYAIHFERSELLIAQGKWIRHISYDSAAWLATFQFRDGDAIAANFLGTLDLKMAAVEVDPFLTAPLAAVARIKTPVEGKFRIIVKGKGGAGVSIQKDFDYFGKEHELPLLGLYEDYQNQIELVFMDEHNGVRCSNPLTVQTEAIPDKPELDIDILKDQLPGLYNGLYVVSNLRLGLDQRGEIRWAYHGEGGSFFRKLANGNFVVSGKDNLYFVEVTMLGQQVRKYTVPNGLHHEIVEMPGGNFLVASYSPPGVPREDRVLEISRETGMVLKTWDFKLILDPARQTLPNAHPEDWLHINALYFDETDNSIVISGRSQSVVVKIDHSTGAIKWILGNHNGWSSAFAPYLLNPVSTTGSPIDASRTDFWSYGQHAIQRLSDGNLLLYDNGDYRGFYDNPDASSASYTRLVEYKINEENMTVQLVWKFDHGKSVFTRYTGYTQDLGATRLGAYMWVSEHTPKILEIDGDGDIVYEATVNRGKNAYYRALKMDVYEGM